MVHPEGTRYVAEETGVLIYLRVSTPRILNRLLSKPTLLLGVRIIHVYQCTSTPLQRTASVARLLPPLAWADVPLVHVYRCTLIDINGHG